MSNEFKFKYTGGENEMRARFDLETGDNYVEQDVTAIKEAINTERQMQEHFGRKDTGYRKMATIPDIVAMKLLVDHQLDLHDPDFMRDSNNLKRLKKILLTEYPELVLNT